MSRRLKQRPLAPVNEPVSTPSLTPTPPAGESFWNRRRLVLAVVLLLVVHLTLAVRSLVEENPTIDEVIHLPAGITYWQTGKFGLYHHNPPLIKLVAALPVLALGAVEVPFNDPSWRNEPQNKAVFAHLFQSDNARQYFELFARARLVMPLFSVLGGLVIFLWSKRLYGPGGGLLSLALWLLCPNILAHCRLVTTDVGSASLGVLATFVFWHSLQQPTWWRTVLAGICLGLAQLSKFSMVLLYGLWPLLGFLHLFTGADDESLTRRVGRSLGKGLLILGLSVVVINVGYGFEGVGIPLGQHEFLSQSLTRPVPPGMWRPPSADPLINALHQRRVNRFRGTWLENLPVPFPKHYVLGFDDQKFEAEGVPANLFNPQIESDEVEGYPVYLNGEVRQKSWWYYYLLTLVYKVPEGTWALFLASVVILVASPRSRASWFDEITVLALPVIVILVMSVLTNINLGLRYVLASFPFVFISIGKVVPWATGLNDRVRRRAAETFLGVALAATLAATLVITPHYLAYFNWVSGGASNGSSHLIDSNIDWGQDLVGLRRWLQMHAPDEPVGLAYFGQINPNIFLFRSEGGFPWFLPPPRPGTIRDDELPPRYRKQGLEGLKFQPGLYAVSATLLQGLPWRVYDDELPRWLPRSVWAGGFTYFKELKPIDQIGHSILLYRVTPAQAEMLSSKYWLPPASREFAGGRK
ncbi:ArnT family glycosyltransferase [Singulisphaera sp. GP187]|uniref:ArnT family glycosyltransferase n=1 Tax=Singulisphaera sp. GP187 TaxID=1882752 RepID=UPI000940A177|nr:glycosyltransferase family 39 protein [Singulisphaera sp. GP187]